MSDDLRDRMASAITARFIAKNGSADEIVRMAHRDTADTVMTEVRPEIERLTQRAEQAEKQRDAAVGSNRTLNAAIARLRGQHRAHEFGHCTSCGISVTWPCPTITALDRPETADATVRDATAPQDWTAEETP